jgi:predicted permease
MLIAALNLVKTGEPKLSLFEQSGQIILVGKLVNPLIVGMIFGTIVMIVGISLDKYLRGKKENGKAFFPFQKVVVPFGCLVIGTLLAWLLTMV